MVMMGTGEGGEVRWRKDIDPWSRSPLLSRISGYASSPTPQSNTRHGNGHIDIKNKMGTDDIVG